MQKSRTPFYEKYVFDIGNVVFECGTDVFFENIGINDRRLIGELLNGPLSSDVISRFDRGEDFDDVLDEQLNNFPNLRSIVSQYKNHWELTIGAVNAEVLKSIEYIKGCGLGIYALSNWPASKISYIDDAVDLLGLFDDVIFSGEVELAKPDDEIFALASQRFHLGQSHIFIDDLEENVSAARRNGIHAVRFTSERELPGLIYGDHLSEKAPQTK